jgi:hypothetical protein
MHATRSTPSLNVETYIHLDGRSLTVTGSVAMAPETAHEAVADVRAHDDDTGREVRLDRCGTLAAKEALYVAAVELWRGGR